MYLKIKNIFACTYTHIFIFKKNLWKGPHKIDTSHLSLAQKVDDLETKAWERLFTIYSLGFPWILFITFSDPPLYNAQSSHYILFPLKLFYFLLYCIPLLKCKGLKISRTLINIALKNICNTFPVHFHLVKQIFWCK